MTSIPWNDASLRPDFIPFPEIPSLWKRFVSWMTGTPQTQPWQRRPNLKAVESPVNMDDYTQGMPSHEPPPGPDLPALAEKIAKDPIAALRLHLRTLNYGDFMEYCEATGSDPKKAWGWATGGKA